MFKTGIQALPSLAARRHALRQWEQTVGGPRFSHCLKGERQWDYYRFLTQQLSRFARLSDFPVDNLRIRIACLESIYKHVHRQRPSLPGASDTYRCLQYNICSLQRKGRDDVDENANGTAANFTVWKGPSPKRSMAKL